MPLSTENNPITLFKTGTQIVHTGSVANTTLFTYEMPAGTMAQGDSLVMTSQMSVNAVFSTVTPNIKMNAGTLFSVIMLVGKTRLYMNRLDCDSITSAAVASYGIAIDNANVTYTTIGGAPVDFNAINTLDFNVTLGNAGDTATLISFYGILIKAK